MCFKNIFNDMIGKLLFNKANAYYFEGNDHVIITVPIQFLDHDIEKVINDFVNPKYDMLIQTCHVVAHDEFIDRIKDVTELYLLKNYLRYSRLLRSNISYHHIGPPQVDITVFTSHPMDFIDHFIKRIRK